MNRGFTLIEISLVMALVAILATISVVNLNVLQQDTYQNTSTDVLLSDLRLQQIKSISGEDNAGGSFEPHGIFFGTNSYTLFAGSTYSPTDPDNFVVELNPNLTFSSVLFADSRIIFEKNSGEILNFTDGNNTVTVANSITGESTTITINQYGVVTNVQ